VTRTVALMDVLLVEVQVAPVMPPPPLLLDEDELLELELLLELEDPVPPYEQYRGLPTPIAGNREAEQVMGPVNVAYTNVPDLP
jgi:hypothetical protein